MTTPTRDASHDRAAVAVPGKRRSDRVASFGSRVAAVVPRPGSESLIAEGANVVLVDRRELMRQGLVRWLQECLPHLHIRSVSDAEEISNGSAPDEELDLIIWSIGAMSVKQAEVLQPLKRLVSRSDSVPVVVLSDLDDLEGMVESIAHGVRGYFPTDLDQNEAAGALRFILGGGTFLPATSVLRWIRSRTGTEYHHHEGFDLDGLTPRELDVLLPLSQGKANKVIARELEISVSTVKAFVSRIRAKLNAGNRTELAVLAGMSLRRQAGEGDPGGTNEPTTAMVREHCGGK